ncbi:hypothetical protein [Pantanalinema sp. GBBB05]|uniref:hypothetical protein n=1 Tax=Pantanalinema sp. GBBB05 TaxID=2604139 RepID=UPI001DF887CA|nr:hypothetical protein [Pantanalinema sp. GBBB05]
MTTQPEVVRHSELLNQLVLDRNTMEELGRIEVLWMYPEVHRVLGFVCKSGFLGNKKTAFKLSQVEALGTNGIITHSPPEDTDAERVRQLESLIGCEVWSRAGDRVGKIIDCVFNLRSGAITDYLMVADQWGGLVGTIYRLPPGKILSWGRRRVLVVETTIQAFDTYREGIPEKLSKVSHELKEDYTQVTQELRSFTHKAQSLTEQAKGQFQTLTARAKERAQLLAEQAKETAHLLNEQLWETGEVLIEQVKERTHDFSEQVKEGTQTFTVQAREVIDSVTGNDVLEDDDFFDEADEITIPSSTTVATHPQQPPVTSVGTPATQPETTPDDYWITEDLELVKRQSAVATEIYTIETTADDDDPWIDDEPVVSTPPEDTIAAARKPENIWMPQPPTAATAVTPPPASDVEEDEIWLFGDEPVADPPLTPIVESTNQVATAQTDEDDDEPWI